MRGEKRKKKEEGGGGDKGENKKVGRGKAGVSNIRKQKDS